MFNLGKQSDVNDKAANLANSVKSNVENVTNEVRDDLRNEAKDVVDLVHEQAEVSKVEAMHVIDSLKSLLSQYTGASNVAELKSQIMDKAMQLKGDVQEEVTHAYETGKARTVQTVHDKPIASLAVAVGAGVLLGYILGSKTHSK
jgi:ElaB/YqjD/DUF883 family membrane-anchored ribosome-binding protein